jgi:hypothetical protein
MPAAVVHRSMSSIGGASPAAAAPSAATAAPGPGLDAVAASTGAAPDSAERGVVASVGRALLAVGDGGVGASMTGGAWRSPVRRLVAGPRDIRVATSIGIPATAGRLTSPRPVARAFAHPATPRSGGSAPGAAVSGTAPIVQSGTTMSRSTPLSSTAAATSGTVRRSTTAPVVPPRLAAAGTRFAGASGPAGSPLSPTALHGDAGHSDVFTASADIGGTNVAAPVRRLPVAPPRGAGPPVRRTIDLEAGAQPTPDGVVHRSLLDRTSQMFASSGNSPEAPHGDASGSSLSAMVAAERTPGQPIVRRLLQAGTAETSFGESEAIPATGEAHAPDRGDLFERIVDALEQRVIDELERRGMRRSPGVF